MYSQYFWFEIGYLYQRKVCRFVPTGLKSMVILKIFSTDATVWPSNHMILGYGAICSLTSTVSALFGGL